MKRFTLTQIFAILFILTTNSQEQLNLNDCVNMALQNNIQIQRQELNVKTNNNNFIQAIANITPNFGVGGSYNYNSGNTFNYNLVRYVDIDYESSSAGLASNVTIFNGLRNLNLIIQSKYNLMKALEDVEKAKNDVTLNVAASYLQILLNQELVKLAEEQVKVTELQVEKTKAQVEVGAIAKGNLLDVQSQLANERVNLINAQNNLTNSYLVMAHLLRYENPSELKIRTIPVDEMALNDELPVLGNLIDGAMQMLPQVNSAEYSVQSAKKGIAIARSNVMPSLTARFDYFTRYESTQTPPDDFVGEYQLIDQYKDRGFNTLSLNLNVPIYNRLGTYRDISNAKISYEDSKLQLEQVKQSLYTSIQEAYSYTLAAMENLNAREDALEANTQAYRYAEERFNVGMVSSVDFNLAKNNYATAKSNFIQAKYEYIFRTKILDFYSGNPIVL